MPLIVRTFPKVSSNPHGPDFGRYCKYQLIKFKPWVDDPSNAWDNGDESEEMFIISYYLFLDTDFAHDNVLDHGRELDKVFATVPGQSYDEDEGDNANSDDDAHENNEEEEEVENWMMLCRLNQHYEESGNPMFENTTDWFEAAKSVPVEVLRDCPGWIYKKKKEMEEGQQLVMQPEVVVIDPVSLNEKQTLAFNIVKSHAQRVATSESLRMIICGTVGTSKTCLINALKQIIGEKSIVT